jgi:hypothetical protein
VRRRYYHDTGEDALLMTVDFAAVPDYWEWLDEQVARLAEKAAAESPA